MERFYFVMARSCVYCMSANRASLEFFCWQGGSQGRIEGPQ